MIKVLLEFIKNILRDLKKYFRFNLFKAKWKVKNRNNFTIAGNIFPINKVEVGKNTYGILNVHSFKCEDEFLKIGNYCSIAEDVNFLLGGEHEYTNLMSYPFKTKMILNKEYEANTKGPIIIDDDVWIGYGSLILSGVHVGQGAIIGAGSIVTKDIPPYAIYVGNTVKKFRFSDKIIKKIKNISFLNIDKDNIEDKLKYLYQNCTEENIDEIISEVIK